MRRHPRLAIHGHNLDDPGVARLLSKLLQDAHTVTVPTDAQLASASQVRASDVDAAIALWNRVQRAAGTGLEGAL